MCLFSFSYPACNVYEPIIVPSVVTLWIKPTDALNSSFIGITTLHVSGNLSAHHQEFLAVHRLWYILCSCDEPFATRSRMELDVQLNSTTCSNVHHNYIKCTNADVRLWTPDDGQKGCPETCRVVISIKLEFSASVGFIHKESVTMHGHTILKKICSLSDSTIILHIIAQKGRVLEKNYWT